MTGERDHETRFLTADSPVSDEAGESVNSRDHPATLAVCFPLSDDLI